MTTRARASRKTPPSESARFPVELVLRFKSPEALDAFIGGFLDGWGEDAPVEIDETSSHATERGPWDLHVYRADGPGHWSDDMQEIE